MLHMVKQQGNAYCKMDIDGDTILYRIAMSELIVVKCSGDPKSDNDDQAL